MGVKKTEKCASEWSRDYTGFDGPPDLEVLTVGALLRIARSLERIANHIGAAVHPEDERLADDQAADAGKVDRRMHAQKGAEAA